MFAVGRRNLLTCVSLNAAFLASVIPCMASPAPGGDLLALFAQAHAGQPLTVVALGGSITQDGAGWIGPWLKNTFTKSAVTAFNAGMSGTGSEFAIFRLERDVIARRPDLVLFEFAVNDGRDRNRTIWSVESVVRRLKNLPHPPAIVMIEAAQKDRDFIPPQREVARHYGLLAIDLQAALQGHIKESSQSWEGLVPDGGHPNGAGHAFYARAIAAVLQIFADKARTLQMPSLGRDLPPPLAKDELILDGKMAPPPAADGWVHEKNIPGWWNMFFRGVTACKEEGKVLTIPFRGTLCGLFFAMNKNSGFLFASVDGAKYEAIDTGWRNGYDYAILGKDLHPGEHLLRVVIPRGESRKAGVALGYFLTAGDNGERNETLVPQGPYTDSVMSRASLDAETANRLAEEQKLVEIPAEDWAWAGPFGNAHEHQSSNADLQTVFWPEEETSNSMNCQARLAEKSALRKWRKCEGASGLINFRQLIGSHEGHFAYVTTQVESPRGQTVRCRSLIDYFCKVWVNDRLIHEVTSAHGHPQIGNWFDLPLEEGRNRVLVKVQSGKVGFSFAMGFLPQGENSPAFHNPLSDPGVAIHPAASDREEETPCALVNAFTKCLTEKQLTIAIIGNSVSAGRTVESGYSAHIADWFQRTFPVARIELKPGIISSIGSEYQLFRMNDKALQSQPDLLVTEFGAANGAWGEAGRAITERSLEGYVRRLRMLNPKADILMNLSIHETMLEAYRQGKIPSSVLFHERVARHYDCALTDPGTLIARRVLAGEPWEKFMKDAIHPGPVGYEVHGEVIRAELDRQYRVYRALSAKETEIHGHPLPEVGLLDDPWSNPRLVPASSATRLNGFRPGSSGRVEFIEADSPDASGSFIPEKGRIVGMLYHCPALTGKKPSAEIEIRADDSREWKRLSLEKEPVVVEDNDRGNVLRRQFFGAYGLPLYSQRIDFRVARNVDAVEPTASVRIVGFFVVE